MSDNNISENKVGAKGYVLPAIVVAFSFLMIYTVVVFIPDMAVFKAAPSAYAQEYVLKDHSGNIIDVDGNLINEDGFLVNEAGRLVDKKGTVLADGANGLLGSKPRKNKAGLGRDIYVREGCVYCHSQFVRPQDRDMGSRVFAGDYANETPNVLGTSRTGPDLSNEGGKLPDAWHIGHLKDPRAYTPGSIMPSFSFLNDADMENLVTYLQTLGRKRFNDPDNRDIYEAYYPEADEAFWKASEHHKPNVDSASAANSGSGIFRQNCAVCHGLNGLGNGPNALAMNKKPANFTRPFFKKYSNETWYYKVSEGVPGTRMPRWKLTLSSEQRWYLVAYLKTLPQNQPIIAEYETIDSEDWKKQSAFNPKLFDSYVYKASHKTPSTGGTTSAH